jgi:succinyl-CoA synthetase beta subunit
MNIHEYQAKAVLAKYGVPVPKGKVALNVAEIDSAIQSLSSSVLVVKAQIHAGGRGKAGGVKVTKSREEAKSAASNMLGMTLITHQTGPEGQRVGKVYIEEGSDIAKEYYLGLIVDRQSSRVTIMASAEGGMEIEEIAVTHPEKIQMVRIDPAAGLQPFHTRKIAKFLGISGEGVKKLTSFIGNLYKAFIATDASQLEINPLVVTKSNDFVALDAKFNFDDNSLFRHPDILDLRDETEEDPLETRAQEVGLSYVKMEGEIGCLVNGAGLAMATMDIIKLYGGSPANFLDVGGGANKEKVTEAFKIILSDSNVKAILVNIFGGIMRCDIIAEGIIAAAKEVGLSLPLVVRLAGTNVELGKSILEKSGLAVISANDLADAADKVVKAIK